MDATLDTGRGRDRVPAAGSMTTRRQSDTATTGRGSPREWELLRAARSGDQHAFGTLVEPYRRELQVHCYRMLGSHADADDALQEALVRAWRGLTGFEGRSSLRAWLYAIATNRCSSALARRPKRVLPIDYAPAADPHDGPADPVREPVWLEPFPDTQLDLETPAGPEARYEQREAVELAFIAALQYLPARQRAVLILRDVLGFSAREAADVLESTPVSIDSALQRAHKAVDDRLPAQSQQQTLRLLGDEHLGELVERYIAAWERNDIDAVVSMLAEDARMVMPPLPSWYSGREQVASFLHDYTLRDGRSWKMVPTSANGQPALATYEWHEQIGVFRPHSISVLTLRGSQIEGIMAFLDPELLELFALPAL
jgi:RNA polymerase sigma-70 factor, ECF subfamily